MNKYERLKIAQDYLDEARDLLSFEADNHYIMNALYYAMFNSILAILDIDDFSGYSHDLIFELFDKKVVKENKFPEELFDALKFAKTFRHKCDNDSICNLRSNPTLEEVKSLYPKAVEFLNTSKQLV
ncbi:HEPN domain protein [Thermodesulfobium narugense DSM 14796]|uniref:HEPN domain protein n=1 Tax=Thermodesulfobium narugense DSM 14796 TaxID=747365 RepID=M1E5Q4_9BACT|nr:HEPN domain-containing protein [Thermodesulfobium narugense]AEE15222.1 HEPN domain protein [Thermodesulfobium narugense DSM 14796]